MVYACCSSPKLNPKSTDLGHANSFEFMLTSCTQCGAYWMSVFCVASGVSGFEPVTAEDAAVMLAMEVGRERKELLRNWRDIHL